ncbi:MarR family transcriptional regulator, partial [Halobacteriales archaeon QS_7_68_65]
KVGVGKAHRTLNELQGRDLVELIVPEDASNGPIFGLTVQGEKVAFHIQRQAEA